MFLLNLQFVGKIKKQEEMYENWPYLLLVCLFIFCQLQIEVIVMLEYDLFQKKIDFF